MTDWPLRPLPEACEINPKLPRDHRLTEDTPVSFVPMSAVDEVTGRISAAQTRPFREVRKGYTWFTDGDVLFAKITPCMENGKAALADGLQGGVGFGSTEFHVLRPRDGVLPEWVRHFVRRESFRKEAKRNFTGTGGQQRVPVGFLERVMMPVPSLDEQRRIVDILSRAEGILRLRRDAEKKAAELVPAIFLEMFGNPSTNPKGWPKAPLCNVASVISGIAKGRRISPGERIEVPYMRVANVKDGYLDLGDVKTIEIRQDELEKLRIEPGDLLMTEGGDPDKLGRAALWSGELSVCVHQNHVFKVRTNRTQLTPRYLRALVGSHYGKSYFARVAKRTTGIASINKTQLSAFLALLPPVGIQEQFDKHVQAVESMLNQQAVATKATAATLAALLASVFSRGRDR